MEHSFDIVKEPWIRVKTLNGELKNVSVRDIFENGHTYKEVSEPNMYHAYGIQNLLIAFFASVYCPKTVEEKFEILEKGQFDISCFDTYVEKCEKNRPNCFNLFGENPFYQNKYAKYKVSATDKYTIEDIENLKIKEKAMIGKIALELPSGNNSVHFVSDELVGKKLSFEEVAKSLVSYGLFQAGQDGPTNSANGVNGGSNHPMYVMLDGQTLFNTIVLNTITEEKWHNEVGVNIPYIGNAAWECEPQLIPKQSVNFVSMVEGLTFQNRFVLLDEPDSKGLVENIYFRAGRVFEIEKGKKSLWRQPNAAYKQVWDEKMKALSQDTYVLCMNKPTDIWTEMGNIFNMNISGTLMSTFDEYMTIFSEYPEDMVELGFSAKNVPYTVYYICIDSGKFPPKKQGVYNNYFPKILLDNQEMLTKFDSLIDGVSSVGEDMTSSLIRLNPKMNKNLKEKYQKKFAEDYYAIIDSELLPQFLSDISDLSSFETEDKVNQFYELCDAFKLKVKDIAVAAYMGVVMSGMNKGLFVEKGCVKGTFGKMNEDIYRLRSSINTTLGIERKVEAVNE